MVTNNTRNSNVETLRLFVMFGILLWHVTVHGYGLAYMQSSDTLTIEHDFMNALSTAMFVPCVDIFVLISGYYGIKFSFKTLARFECQAIFYSYLMAFAAFYFFGNSNNLLEKIFPIIGNRWWFLTVYVMLLIIAPILNEGIKRLTEKQHLAIIVMLVAINCIGYMFLRQIGNGNTLQFFILLYLIGQYLHSYKDKYKMFANTRLTVLLSIICTAINFIAVYFCLQSCVQHPILVTKYMMLYLSYNNPVVLLQAIFILCAVLSLNPTFNIKINTLARHVFAVYLITECAGKTFYKMLKDCFNSNFFFGMSACIGVFFVCLLIEAIRSKCYDIICNKVSLLRHK